jgi:hypothetical protein
MSKLHRAPLITGHTAVFGETASRVENLTVVLTKAQQLWSEKIQQHKIGRNSGIPRPSWALVETKNSKSKLACIH